MLKKLRASAKTMLTSMIAPFMTLKVEKVYWLWLVILLISFIGSFVDICNGTFIENTKQGVLYSTNFAVLAPFLIDFLVAYSNLNRSKRKEEFSVYKVWTISSCFVMILFIFVLYSTAARSVIWPQIVCTLIVCCLSFYTYLVNKMDQHAQLLVDFKDTSYAEAESKLVTDMRKSAAALTVVTTKEGKEVGL